MHKVIYDTDPGIDDAMALVFQALSPDIELLGITSVFGNATIDTTTRNALYLAHRFAPGVPVARGAGEPLEGSAPAPLPAIHGDDGLGNIGVVPPVHAMPDARAASRFIVDTVRRHPGEVTLLAVGPLTNLALALVDDAGIASLVKQVIVMGVPSESTACQAMSRPRRKRICTAMRARPISYSVPIGPLSSSAST